MDPSIVPLRTPGPKSSWHTGVLLVAGVLASNWLRERYGLAAFVAGIFGTTLAGRVFDELRAKYKRAR